MAGSGVWLDQMNSGNKCRDEMVSMAVSEMVSLKKCTEGSGKNQSFSVECRRGSLVTRSKKFRCGDRGFEDPDARLRAIRFGFLTEGLVAFRTFLFEGSKRRGFVYICVRKSRACGLRFADVVIRVDSGVARSISFKGSGSSDGDDDAVERALGFVRGSGFGNWVRWFLGQQVEGSSPQQGEGVCGRCGQQKQLQQQQEEYDDHECEQQISEDYLCFYCKKIERGEITIIRMDEQGEYNTVPVEETCTDNKSVGLSVGESVCSVCGCEDNEYFEIMIHPCSCNGGSILAHPTCVSASLETRRTGSNQAPASCKICGGRGTLNVGSTDEGSSKLTGVNPNFKRNMTNATQKKGVKRVASDLTNGGVGKADLSENHPHSKIFNEESSGKTVQDSQKEDFSISESEKLEVIIPTRRFDDAVASVPIKKRKYTLFQPPSPPPASPSPASPLESSSPAPAAPLVCSEVPSAEQEQGEQRVLEGMDITGESLQEKGAEVTGQSSNENTWKMPSSVDYFPQDIGDANLSRDSRLLMSASIGEPASSSLDDTVSKVGLINFSNPTCTPVGLNDGDIGSQDDQQEAYACMDALKQEEGSRRRDHVLESDLLLTAQKKSLVIKGISDCNNLSKTNDHITCMETEESMKLALCCNSIFLGSGNHLETTGCSKMSTVAGECSSAGLLKDGEKQEKGMLLRLDSGYFNDDRSHWDLNTPMDSWEKQPDVVNTDPKPEFLPGDTANNKLEHLDGIHILASESKEDSGKSEQDMLSKVSQADQDHNALNSEGLANEKDSELDTSLSLQPDAILNQSKMNHAYINKSVSLSEELVAERELNLSMAPSGRACELVTNISCVDARDVRHLIEKPSDLLLATDPPLQSDSHLDNTPIDDNVDMFDKTESSPDCKQEKEPAEDDFEEIEGTSHKGNSSDPETNYENPDLVQKGSPSSPPRDQHVVKTVNEDSVVNDANAVTIGATDACAVDTNTNSENPGSPELGLDKQSTEDATEIAYGGDSEFDGYDDEYELVSDTEKEFEHAENEHQVEEGEYRETGLHNWDKDDTGEELEDEHVDYGDSDGRDADDLGMDLDYRGKDVEHEKNWDDGQQSEMEEKYDTDSHHEEHDSQFEGAVQVNEAGEEDTQCESVGAEIDIEHVTEKGEHKGDVNVSQTTELLGEDISLEVELKCHQDQNKGAAAKSREGRFFTRQKSSGWDQLPDGFESAAEALKAVHGTFNKRGRGAALVSGGRIGPMSSRGASSRRDAGYGERMDVDDSMYRKEGFFIRGRDGSLSTSLSFPSRKPTRGRIVGRGGGPSRGMHNMGRADPWADGGTRHLGPHRHHSPDFYDDHVGFGPHVSANAAAMSAAKVESSGFVVSMDGTVTKVLRGGIRGRRGRGTLMGRGSPMGIEESRDFELQMNMGRGGLMSDTGMNMSRARAVGLGPDRISAGSHVGRERYRDLSYGNNRWDHSIGDSPHRLEHQLRERNRSFTPPPGRRLTRMLRSHTESRSRSGTRSPRPKSPPRGSAGAGIGRGPAPRRRSRTPPALRSESRMDRPKSPLFHSVGSFEHRMSFLPSSRTRRSPPQSSKWSYDRRDTNHFKDSEYKRSFRTGSPSKRMSPRGVHESGLMGSPGRLKHSEYRGTVYSSRTAEFGSDSRRFKRDESEDVRLKQNDNSGRSVEVGSTDIRRYRRQDDDASCQPRNSRAKDAGISREQGRGDHNSRL